MAADRYKEANSLTKLSYNLRDERYQAGTGPKGNPYYKNRKVKTWEAMACEAIPNRSVDKSPVRWNNRIAIIGGSNVAHCGDEGSASLDAVKAIVVFLKKEGSKPILVFDANIGFKVAGKHMNVEDLIKALGSDVETEIVESGTVADRRIIELAEQRKATIVSNDLFRDSLRARPIPKRRGFFLPKYVIIRDVTHRVRFSPPWESLVSQPSSDIPQVACRLAVPSRMITFLLGDLPSLWQDRC